MKIKKFLIFVLILISMTSLVVGFSFADIFNLNFLTGRAVINQDPVVNLGMPSDTQVIGNPVTFTWTYFDAEDEPMESYTILVDDNQRFTHAFASYGIKGDSQKVYLPLQDGTYYWRVVVTDDHGTGFSEIRQFYLTNKEKLCDDGTKYYQCSSNKPNYCKAGELVKDCLKCGCDRGGICSQGGDCVELKCVDGTVYGDCSINKPKYCLNSGVLRDTCSLCGCPGDLECTSDGTCKEKVIEPIIQQPEATKTPETGFIGILKRIASVFKYIFTGQAL